MTKRALVLGGGGVAGIAWEVGLLVGLVEAGVDTRNADLFVGTSAGANAAALLTSGASMEELFQRQTDPALQAKELPAKMSAEQTSGGAARVLPENTDIIKILQQIGTQALATPTVAEEARLMVIRSRLPVYSWPQSRLILVAVDTRSGERIAFERESGVNLVDAVAASSAVPGVWPPVTINGHRYMDGGAYSIANVDLAAGFDRVLVIQPEIPPLPLIPLDKQLASLRSSGARVEVIMPDEAMRAALASVGGNALDPSIRGLAARAGHKQASNVAAQVASLWR